MHLGRPETLIFLICVLCCGSLLGALGALRLRAWLQARRFRRRMVHAREGELKALQTLARQGYQVVDQQVRRTTRMVVDGEPIDCEVVADLLARRGRKIFVVEVKTGQEAPDPTSARTRRQLLEYSRVFDCDGVVLADMEADRLHSVEFDRVSPPRRFQVLLLIAVSALSVGMFIGWVLHAAWG